jgi:hypothetical protein
VTDVAILLGMLLGALLVLGAALASVWLQQRSATRAEHATSSSCHHNHPAPADPGSREAGTACTRPGRRTTRE